MKKFLLMSMLLGVVTLGANGQTVTIGDEWDNYGEYDDYDGYAPAYTGSAGDHAPMALEFTYSGSQFIYTSEELSELAGSNITDLAFKVAVTGFIEVPSTISVKIYMAETNLDTPYKNSNNKAVFFPVDNESSVYEGELSIEDEYLSDYIWYNDCWAKEMTFTLDKPFYYSGENNLLITFVVEGDGTEASSLSDFNFMSSGINNRAIAYGVSPYNGSSFDDVLSGTRITPLTNNHIIEAPAIQIEGTTGTPIAETWQSYVPAEDVDLDFAEGTLDAYTVTATSDGKATLKRVTSAKAGSALLLKKSIIPSIQTTGSAAANSDNLLLVSNGTVEGDGTIFALANKSQGIGFYKVGDGVKIPEGKVYLKISSATNEFVGFDTTTGIESIASETPAQRDNAIYTLTGARVSHPTKGIYIQNGKKFVVK